MPVWNGGAVTRVSQRGQQFGVIGSISAVPRHVAIIMDGNGRWANSRGLPRKLGHRMGVEAVRRTVRAAIDLKIAYLTLFSFSSENWARPATEINDLMGLLKRFIRGDLEDLHKAGVAIRVIGERGRVDPELLALIDEARAKTRDNQALTLVIAFNYGARTEIASAARRLAERVQRGELEASAISETMLAQELDTTGIPDPDLVIRTSGEQRLSNFLLWQAAYAELIFMDVKWPDFGRDQLQQAVAIFQSRDRRYGGLPQEVLGS